MPAPAGVSEDLLEGWYRAHFVALVRLGTLAWGDRPNLRLVRPLL